MKPVLILQHLDMDGPAYLGTWLRREGVPVDVRCTEAGDAFPADLSAYRALAILGGTMSANDPIPSLRRAEDLIRQGVNQGIPVIGHCLGGQLMSRALGGSVGRSPSPEVGWRPIQATATGLAWLGASELTVMQWHAEAFSLPAGAELLAGNAACPHQAFALGPHLAMQFHVEVDAEKLALWTEEAQSDPAHPETVQDAATLRAGTRQHLAAQQALADRLYRRWMDRARG